MKLLTVAASSGASPFSHLHQAPSFLPAGVLVERYSKTWQRLRKRRTRKKKTLSMKTNLAQLRPFVAEVMQRVVGNNVTQALQRISLMETDSHRRLW